MKTTINLNIERIVLHGLEGINRRAIVEALTQELTRQLAQPQSWKSENIARTITNISLEGNNDMGELGRTLAQGLGGILSNQKAATGVHKAQSTGNQQRDGNYE